MRVRGAPADALSHHVGVYGQSGGWRANVHVCTAVVTTKHARDIKKDAASSSFVRFLAASIWRNHSTPCALRDFKCVQLRTEHMWLIHCHMAWIAQCSQECA